MPLSTNTYTYNGGPQTFAATFADGYIERDHVTAYRVGDFDGLGEQIYLDFTWNSDAEILVTNSLTIGDEIVVQRTVPKDEQLVDLSSEGGLTRESLERNARQSLHAVHEVLDGRTTAIENIDQLVAQAEAAAQQALDAVATVRYKGTPRYYDSHVLRTDIGLGVLADGDLFLLHNEPMRVHRAWDGNPRSWLFNNNGYVNYGVKTENNLPLNYYMFIGFKTQDNNKLFIHTSPDGRRFYRMNQEPIMRGAGDSTIGGRDSQAFWNRWLGEFWFPVTSGTEVTTYDASTFRSPDLVAFDNSTILLGNDGIRGEMVDQGEIPVRRQWSNRFYDFDNKLYIITSLQVLENQPNPFGGDGPALRPYIAEVLDASDPDNLVFGPVTQMDFGPTDDAKLDPDFIKVDGVFYACIKDSSTRTIEVWSGTDLFGTFTKLETIDLNTDPADFNSLEGPTWAVHRYFNPDDTEEVLVKYRIHLANNRDASDKLIGVPRFTEATSPAGPYGAIERLEFSHATRNGTTTNLSMVDDPRALRVALAAEGIYGGMTVDGVDEAHQLDAGTHLLYPQEKFEYFILGEAGSTQVTINEKVANTFYVAVHNTNPAATIEFLATDWCRPFTVGGGEQQLVQVMWSEQINKYIPVGRFGTGGGSTSLASPRNMFLASFFTTQDDRTIHLHVSLDGQNWSVINVEGLSVTDTIPFDQGGCAISYFNDEFWIFGTGNNPGVHDFVVYRSPDLTRWSKHQVAFQGGPILSDTEPYAGGTVPADRLWAPEVLVDDDGRVYMYMTIRYQEGETRIYGDQINGYRVFVSEFTDFANLTFTAPTLVDTGDTNSQIDLHVIKHDGVYYASLKNEAQRRIRIYSGTSPTGPFTYTGREFFDNERSHEAPSIVPVYYTAGISDDTEVVRWRLYVDNNRTNPGAPFAGIGEPDADSIIGQQLFYESEGDTPASTWGPAQKPSFDLPVRHGTVINLRNFPPEAAQKVSIAAAASKSPRKALTREIELTAGDNYIHPREGEIYFVNGTTVANVYILEGGADQFFLAKYAANDTAGINVMDTDFVPSAYTFGFGQNADTWVEFRRRGERDLFVMGNQTTVTGGGASGITVEDEGTPLTTLATTLNFTGTGVTVTGSGAEKTVNIPGGGGTSLITENTADGAKFIASGAPGSENTEAGVLNLYPQGTDGVGIGVSRLGFAMSGGSGLGYVEARNNGRLEVTVSQAGTDIIRNAGAVSDVYDIGSGTVVDPNNGDFQYVVLSAARTLDIANFLNGDKVLLDVRNADTNTLTITSSTGTLRWIGGSAPSSFEVRTLIGIAKRGTDIFIGAVGF